MDVVEKINKRYYYGYTISSTVITKGDNRNSVYVGRAYSTNAKVWQSLHSTTNSNDPYKPLTLYN